MTIELKENERLDDLQRNGLQIIQKTDGFCFGMDAVLLSGFATVKPGERVLDLGTGTGIIPLLLSAKTEGEHFSALEIQDEIARMAERSVKLNHLENKIEIVHGDIKEASRIFGAASFDVVTTNPPYMNDSRQKFLEAPPVLSPDLSPQASPKTRKMFLPTSRSLETPSQESPPR